MSPRADAALHGALAVLAIALAIHASSDPRNETVGSVEVLDCHVDAVEYRSERRDVDLGREGDRVWIRVARRPEGETAVERRFVGGEDAETYIDALTPLVARRSLGALEGDALVDVGLHEPEGLLTLKCGDDEHAFDVGGRAYGTGDRYIRRDGGDEVLLVPSTLVRALATAEVRLMQQRLHRFDYREASRARVEATQSWMLEHRNRRSHDAAWIDASDPETRRRDLDRFMRALSQLSVREYLEQDPELGERIVRVELSDREELGWVEVHRGPDALTWYARSEETNGWVTLIPSSGSGLLRALEAVTDASP